MKQSKVSVLDTEYLVNIGERKEIGLSEENMGECRIYSKKINVLDSMDDCVLVSESEQRAREIIAHEIFHAFCNESGLAVDDDTEELFATWYMKVWRKMSNAILQVLDENGLLDETSV